MRRYQHTLLGIAVLLLPSITLAQIYLGPEDVLYMNAKQTQRLNPRSAERSVIEREAKLKGQQSSVRPSVKEWWDESETNAPTIQDVVTPHLSDETTFTPKHEAASSAASSKPSLHPGANVKYLGNTDRIQDRLLRRIQDGQYRVVPVELPEVVRYRSTYLVHSGPESVLVVLAMIPAAYYVVRKARKMEKFVR